LQIATRRLNHMTIWHKFDRYASLVRQEVLGWQTKAKDVAANKTLLGTRRFTGLHCGSAVCELRYIPTIVEWWSAVQLIRRLIGVGRQSTKLYVIKNIIMKISNNIIFGYYFEGQTAGLSCKTERYRCVACTVYDSIAYNFCAHLYSVKIKTHNPRGAL